MTNRDYINALDNKSFIDVIKMIALNNMFEFIDWDSWLNSEFSKDVLSDTKFVLGEPTSCKKFKPTPVDKCSTVNGMMLRNYRNSHEITVNEVCKLTGLSKSAISNFEIGRSKLSVSNLEMIESKLGMDHHCLVDNQRSIENYDEDLGSLLKRAMNDNNISLSQASAQLGVMAPTVKRWINGVTVPSHKTTPSILSTFKLDFETYKRALEVSKEKLSLNN